jgi:arylsulfatase A-like enzyme
VLPLVRLIESLKAAGLYENTLIAIYTLDGGRAPAANSSGGEGKSGLMLAGGMIQGGYYGDVGIAGDDGDGHVYSYSAPDPATGAPLGTRHRQLRPPRPAPTSGAPS